MTNIKENILTYIELYQQNPIKLVTLILDIGIVIFLAYNLLKIVKDRCSTTHPSFNYLQIS